jgi:hypothetical protein
MARTSTKAWYSALERAGLEDSRDYRATYFISKRQVTRAIHLVVYL